MRKAFEPGNLTVTVAEAVVTASAASAAVLFELPIWAMFVGWIAYFTRGLDLRNGLVNFGCVVIGLGLGLAAASVLGSLGGPPGVIELAAVVFGVALVVLSLRFLPVFNNLLGFFLGLVAWFAAHQPVSVSALLTLAFAAALGSGAGWFAHRLQTRLSAPAATHPV
ncbi:DUF1097 domain-containing protein [Azospirillum sp. ST 5-10]|uniref:DUF1097 domain-containing protein n=1 Tax=unclassified Azospirillum TaxID=2630922 RepID=UPI003F49ECEB